MRFLIWFFVLAFGVQVHAKKLNELKWNVFIKTYGREKFAVNFPKDPKTLIYELKNLEKKGLFVQSSDGDIDYMLQVSEKYSSDEKEILLNALKYLKKFAFVDIVKFSFNENEKNKILDIIFKDKFLLLFCKARIIVTKNNIYTFFTSYKKGMNEQHNFFTKSFHIAS
jgi:hypothetical protein